MGRKHLASHEMRTSELSPFVYVEINSSTQIRIDPKGTAPMNKLKILFEDV